VRDLKGEAERRVVAYRIAAERLWCRHRWVSGLGCSPVAWGSWRSRRHCCDRVL